MQKKDIQVGAQYRIHHTSGWITVKVLRAIETGPVISRMLNRRNMTHWTCLNLKTGREITVKSAGKFHTIIKPAEETI